VLTVMVKIAIAHSTGRSLIMQGRQRIVTTRSSAPNAATLVAAAMNPVTASVPR
jgi:hypothetical protein